MKAMFQRDILPHIAAAGGGAAIHIRTLHTFGAGESTVAERLGALMQRGRNPSVGTTVANGVVSVRIYSSFESPERALRELEQTCDACRQALGDLIYGQDEETLADVVARMLIERSRTIATAESCTGGLLSKYLTDIAGSSAYFVQGWVTYTNESKQKLLGVPGELIERHGAVSEPVAAAMAQGAMRLSGASYGVGISGIAGPSGGTPQKPVGTVCIALADAGETAVRTFVFPGDREFIRDRAAKMALSILRFRMLDRELSF
jgi:nicotinamide-nucleotide amidase